MASGFGDPMAVAYEASRVGAEGTGAHRAEGPGGLPSRSPSNGS